MKKKQILSTALATLLVTNILSGCANTKRQTSEPSMSNSIEEMEIIKDYISALSTEEVLTENSDYRISTIDISKFYKENDDTLYCLPAGYIEFEGKYYKIERINTIQYLKPASIVKLDDGTQIYSCPPGYKLVGDMAVLVKIKYELVTDEEEVRIVIENYFSENSLKLEK